MPVDPQSTGSVQQKDLQSWYGSGGGSGGSGGGGATTVAYGTSLPASPTDGQEAILVDQVADPAYVWRFRYNAGSMSDYKWEFVGGGSWIKANYSDYTPSPLSQWIVDKFPSMYIVHAGEYEAGFSAEINPPTGGLTYLIGMTLSVSGLRQNQIEAMSYSQGTDHLGRAGLPLTLAANDILASAYYSTVSMQFLAPCMNLRPKRVS